MTLTLLGSYGAKMRTQSWSTASWQVRAYDAAMRSLLLILPPRTGRTAPWWVECWLPC